MRSTAYDPSAVPEWARQSIARTERGRPGDLSGQAAPRRRDRSRHAVHGQAWYPPGGGW